MRIGLLGGTFNPIHLGHLILAQQAVETLDLSRLLFIPCARPPHKTGAPPVAGEHRRAMIEAAIEGSLLFECSDIELQRGGVSYAVDTVRAVAAQHPGAELCFLIGADMLADLHTWKAVYELLALCRFVTFARPGFNAASLSAAARLLDPPWPERLRADMVSGRQVDISSTDIRYRVAEGLSIRYLVPREVELYIAEHGLYGA
jgi:nicotinate-nucleotide adenylyltransferase